jgi:Ca2+-binding RTX toxin-like protein
VRKTAPHRRIPSYYEFATHRQAGNDLAGCGDGNGTLNAYAGNDGLNSCGGNDTLIAKISDTDTLDGDEGDDTFNVASNGLAYNSTFIGGAGTDFKAIEFRYVVAKRRS